MALGVSRRFAQPPLSARLTEFSEEPVDIEWLGLSCLLYNSTPVAGEVLWVSRYCSGKAVYLVTFVMGRAGRREWALWSDVASKGSEVYARQAAR